MKGFSLLELLVAICLSFLLLDGVMNLYDSFKRHYHYADALVSIQENLRIINQLFYSDIATAGYIGCGKLSPYYSVIHDVDIPTTRSIQGYDASTATQIFALPTSGKASVVPKTDVIAITKAQSLIADLLQMDSNSMLVSAKPIFHENEILIISDCIKANIFQIKSVFFSDLGQQLIPYQLTQFYAAPAQVSQLIRRIYYIGDTGRKSQRHQPLYALYKADFPGSKQELVENIVEMHIEYGVYNHSLEYFTSDAIKDWSKVIAIRFYLMLQSEDHQFQIPQELIIKLQESQGII